MNPFSTYHPPGFSTVNVYMFSDDAEGLIRFLKNAFYAEEVNRSMRDDVVANCILRIGDSCIMIAQGRGEYFTKGAGCYFYVNDVDAFHQRALEFGAEEVYPPGDTDYGDRQSGIKDPSGNFWWISMRLEEKDYE